MQNLEKGGPEPAFLFFISINTTGTGFVHEAQLDSSCLQFADHLVQRAEIASNGAVQPNLSVPAVIGQRYFDGIFVCIQTGECDTLFHGLPPWLWLFMGFLQSPYNPRCKGQVSHFFTVSHNV
jgi:hypothetical protein